VVAVDPQGHFYVTWVGFVRTGGQGATDMHIYVSKLGAMDTFGTPVETSDGSTTSSLDKPWITVDGAGAVLNTWADLGNGALLFAKSTDGGATFTRSTIVSNGGRNLMFPCSDPATPTGPYYVTYIAGSNVGVRRSMDGGTTWALVVPNAPATDAVFQDPTCAVHGNDLWVAYAQGTQGFTSASTPPGDAVHVLHSPDSGATYGAAVTVSNGPSGSEYLLPQLTRTAGGKLEMIYYQGAGEGSPATLVRAESADQGATWTSSAAYMPGTFTRNRAAVSWLGDYEGLFAAGGNLYSVFGDNTLSGHTHIRFLRFAIP